MDEICYALQDMKFKTLSNHQIIFSGDVGIHMNVNEYVYNVSYANSVLD
jgi:hypothetical protein